MAEVERQVGVDQSWRLHSRGRHLRRIVGGLLTALLVGLPGFVDSGPLSSRPAQAAVGCTAAGCDGKHADEQGCITTDPSDRVTVGGFQINLDEATPAIAYYSRACHSVWYEFRTASTAQFLHFTLWAQPTYGGIERVMESGEGHLYRRVTGTTDLYRTVMASWDYSISGCYSTRWGGEVSRPTTCSPWT